MLASMQGLSYLIVLLLCMIEGPIFTLASSFAASLGLFNPFIIYVIALLGNFIPDVIYYWIGRLSGRKKLRSYIEKILTQKRIEKIEHLLHTHTWKTMVVIKIVPIFSVPGLLLAGYTKVPFRKYLACTCSVDLPFIAFLVVLGYYSGSAFIIVSENLGYGQLFLALFILLMIGLWFLVKFILQKESKKIEKI